MTLPIIVLVGDTAVVRTLAPSALGHSFFLVSAKVTRTQRFWGEGIPAEGASIRVELREPVLQKLESRPESDGDSAICEKLNLHNDDLSLVFPTGILRIDQKIKDGAITCRIFVKYNFKLKLLSVECYVFRTLIYR
jgi:hypothetical protein